MLYDILTKLKRNLILPSTTFSDLLSKKKLHHNN